MASGGREERNTQHENDLPLAARLNQLASGRDLRDQLHLHARAERQSTANEIRRLVLHGVLHLLGYDHEKDRGEMTTLELSLREHFGIAGEKAGRQERIKGQKGKVKSPK